MEVLRDRTFCVGENGVAGWRIYQALAAFLVGSAGVWVFAYFMTGLARAGVLSGMFLTSTCIFCEMT